MTLNLIPLVNLLGPLYLLSLNLAGISYICQRKDPSRKKSLHNLLRLNPLTPNLLTSTTLSKGSPHQYLFILQRTNLKSLRSIKLEETTRSLVKIH